MAARIPLVLLPGLVNDAHIFARLSSLLRASAGPIDADLTTRDTMAELADDVLAKAPQRFALAGLSMGGYCALEIAHRAPDRVVALALIDTSARPDGDEAKANRERQIARVRAGEFDAVVDELLRKWVHPSRLADAAVADVVRAMARSHGPAVFERQQRAIMSRADSRPRLAAIRCPTVVICGADDAIMPREIHSELAAGIPGAALVAVPECGHLAPIERPEAVAAALAALLAKAR